MLEADGYQPYLISPEKGLRSLIKIVLELAKEPSRLCVDEVSAMLVLLRFYPFVSIAFLFVPVKQFSFFSRIGASGAC